MKTGKPNRLRFFQWLRDLTPSCREASQLQSRALDEALPARIRLGLSCHLVLCGWCRRYGRHLRFLDQALRKNGDRLAGNPHYALTSEAREQIKERLRREP